MLLQYDSRVDCLSPEYTSYLIFAWIMAILWPIGCPLSLLLLLRSYNVPQIAARKLRAASIRAFLVYSLAKASDVGVDATETAPVGDSSASEAPLEDSVRLGRRRSTGTGAGGRRGAALAGEASIAPVASISYTSTTLGGSGAGVAPGTGKGPVGSSGERSGEAEPGADGELAAASSVGGSAPMSSSCSWKRTDTAAAGTRGGAPPGARRR